MSWLRLDDGWPEHEAVVGLKPAEKVLWITAAAWSARQSTLGRIPKAAMPVLAAQAGAAKTAVNALVAAGLLAVTSEGWEFTEVLNPFPTQEAIDAKRRRDRERQAARRARDNPHVSRCDTEATRQRQPSDVTQKVAVTSLGVSIPEPEPENVNGFTSTTTVVPLVTGGGGGDQESRVKSAIKALAAAEPIRANVTNPAGYRASIERRIAAEHTQELTRLAAEHPTLSGPELAAMIGLLTAPKAKPEPIEPAYRDTRITPESCPKCHDRGWTVDDDDNATICGCGAAS